MTRKPGPAAFGTRGKAPSNTTILSPVTRAHDRANYASLAVKVVVAVWIVVVTMVVFWPF